MIEVVHLIGIGTVGKSRKVIAVANGGLSSWTRDDAYIRLVQLAKVEFGPIRRG